MLHCSVKCICGFCSYYLDMFFGICNPRYSNLMVVVGKTLGTHGPDERRQHDIVA